MQNQVVILRGVLEVKFTKYCTCAAKNPGQHGGYSWLWTGFSSISVLEPYMLEAYLGKNRPDKVRIFFDSLLDLCPTLARYEGVRNNQFCLPCFLHICNTARSKLYVALACISFFLL